MSKRTRQQAIVDIVSQRPVASQGALVDELKKIGIHVTRPTLSRDIAELNLLKTKEGYRRPQDAVGGPRFRMLDLTESLKQSVFKVETASNLVVLKTVYGTARQVSMALDSSRELRTVGTIAGSDTVVLVTPSETDARSLKGEILEVIA